MDPIIQALKTPEECDHFIKTYTALIKQARQKAVELRAQRHSAPNEVEEELYKAVYVYEEILTQKNKRRTRASRTWQMVDKYGIVEAAERIVNRPIEPQGYTFLVESGMQKLTFEAIIAKHPEVFNSEVVMRAKQRLKEYENLPY